MKKLIAHRKTNGWNTSTLIFISLTFMVIWLPFVRSIFDGDSYVWGTNFFGLELAGRGISLDFLFLLVQVAFYFLVMYSFYWLSNRILFYILLGLWYLNSFGNLLVYMLLQDDVMFHGDTLNVHISLFWIVIPLSIIALFLVYNVIVKDMKSENVSIKWNKKNNIYLLLILGPIPIQAILLASGEPHGITDQIGVIISILQCFLIPLILVPRKSKAQ